MEPKRSMTAEEIRSRVARFTDLKPMSTSSDLDWVPQEAMDVIFARDLRPIIIEQTKNPFGKTAAIYGAAGTTMNVSIMPPGQGPCLHAHDNTLRDLRGPRRHDRVPGRPRGGGEGDPRQVGHVLVPPLAPTGVSATPARTTRYCSP